MLVCTYLYAMSLLRFHFTSSNGDTNSEQKLEQQFTPFLILISILTVIYLFMLLSRKPFRGCDCLSSNLRTFRNSVNENIVQLQNLHTVFFLIFSAKRASEVEQGDPRLGLCLQLNWAKWTPPRVFSLMPTERQHASAMQKCTKA